MMKSSKKTNSRVKKINGVFIIYRKMKTLVLDLMEKLCDCDVATETKTHTVTVYFWEWDENEGGKVGTWNVSYGC
jgi:hypothetical protein